MAERSFYYVTSTGVTWVYTGRGVDLDPITGNRRVCVVDSAVDLEVDCPALRLAGGESVKGMDRVLDMYRFFMEVGVDRGTRVVAVGGGAVLDAVGFAAGTYMRGLPLVNVPTTLLAMVDTAVGGKTAVDWGEVKNLIGVFHQPVAVVNDVRRLDTLPDEQLRSGLAEVVKYGLTLDRDLLAFVEDNAERVLARDGDTLVALVDWAARTKARVVEADERETRGVRTVLNFGHTVGHAVELLAGMPHGHAVSVGMALELAFAERLGYAGGGVADRAARLLRRLGLPTCVEVDWGKAAALLVYDKKRARGEIALPVPVAPGAHAVVRVPLEELRSFLVSEAPRICG